VAEFAGSESKACPRPLSKCFSETQMKTSCYNSTPLHTLPSQSRPSLFSVD
jgi:hypothetical protein